MNKLLLNKLLYDFKENCFEERDNAILLKKDCDFEKTLSIKITCLTREKIFKMAILIMRYIKINDGVSVLNLMPQLKKKVKVHVHQLQKLNQGNYEDNKQYLHGMVKFIYMWYFQVFSSQVSIQ